MHWGTVAPFLFVCATVVACGQPPVNTTKVEKTEPKTEEALSALDQDLPSPAVAVDITRRAFAVISDPNLGFIGWVSTVQECYDGLEPSDLAGRVYCIQLDATAWAFESGVPAEWQASDAASDDYFTNDPFMRRQMKFAPPIDPSLSATEAHRRKNDVLRALTMIRNKVMEEEVARLQDDRGGKKEAITP